MGRRVTIFGVVSSSIGVFVGISAFIVFFIVYSNIRAGTWAALSAVFAAICLQLNVLHMRDKLEHYHSPQTLSGLEALGFVVFVCASGFMVWYIFETIYFHIPMMPAKDSFVCVAVFAFMTAKWGFGLYMTSKRYVKILQRSAL